MEDFQREPIQEEPIQAEPVQGTPPTGSPRPQGTSQTPARTGRWMGQSPAEIAGELVDALQGTGAKGRVLTEAIIAAGLAEDPAALRRAYQQNKTAVDAYLAEINTSALARQSGVNDTAETAGVGAGLGFACGAILTYFVRQFFK